MIPSGEQHTWGITDAGDLRNQLSMRTCGSTRSRSRTRALNARSLPPSGWEGTSRVSAESVSSKGAPPSGTGFLLSLAAASGGRGGGLGLKLKFVLTSGDSWSDPGNFKTGRVDSELTPLEWGAALVQVPTWFQSCRPGRESRKEIDLDLEVLLQVHAAKEEASKNGTNCTGIKEDSKIALFCVRERNKWKCIHFRWMLVLCDSYLNIPYFPVTLPVAFLRSRVFFLDFLHPAVITYLT